MQTISLEHASNSSLYESSAGAAWHPAAAKYAAKAISKRPATVQLQMLSYQVQTNRNGGANMGQQGG
jgi:hypothetical protein